MISRPVPIRHVSVHVITGMMYVMTSVPRPLTSTLKCKCMLHNSDVKFKVNVKTHDICRRQRHTWHMCHHINN